MNSGLVRSIAALLSRSRNLFSRWKDSSPEHIHARGARGEKLAAKFLRKQGYKVLYRNFKLKRDGVGQIDLVCRDHETLVFVEVKTRNTQYFGRPVEAVHSDQQRRISRGALAWLRMLDNPDIPFRFDVVEVLVEENAKPHLALVQDAFQLSKPYRY
jgi:putative endonuclease